MYLFICIYVSASRAPPHRPPPAPPVGVGWGVGVWGVSCALVLLQAFMHVLHHVGPALQQNAASACTAVLQKPFKLYQIGPYDGFPLISLRKPSKRLAWPCAPSWRPCPVWGGPAMLDAGTYMVIDMGLGSCD